MDPECAEWVAQVEAAVGAAVATHQYRTAAGSMVALPMKLPLGAWVSQVGAKADNRTQAPFKRSIVTPSRQSRAALSLRYDVSFRRSIKAVPPRYSVDADGSFTFDTSDPFTLAAIGDTRGLVALVESSPELLSAQDESGDSLLYKAARSGFCDMVEALTAKGCDVNIVKHMGSSSLHAASYFGHEIVVASLLGRDCDRSLKNKYGNTALDEACTPAIRELLAAEVEVSLRKLVDAGVGSCLRPISHDSEVVAWRVDRQPELIMDSLGVGTPKIPADWETVWHGTKAEHLESIMRHNLQAAGSGRSGALDAPQDNHIALGKTVFGMENFAGAIFVSPSVAYAAHPCYAGRLIGGGVEFILLIEARVRPRSYKTFASTTGNAYISLDADVHLEAELDGHPGQFGHPEIHGEEPGGDDSVNTIMRVDGSDGRTNVVVTAVVLLKRKFLAETTLSNKAVSGILTGEEVYESTLSCRQEMEMLSANAGELGVPDLAAHIAEIVEALATMPGEMDAKEHDRRFALFMYTKETLVYSQFNEALRRKGSALDRWRPYLWHLERSLRDLPDVQRTVHRGVAKLPFLDHYGQSKKVRWQGFTCTSTSTAVAKQFAQQPSEGEGVIFKIEIYNGKDVAPYSWIPSEKELLLSPSMEFVVTKSLHVPSSGELAGCRVIEMQQLSSTTLWS
jgi:hypothetical protein